MTNETFEQLKVAYESGLAAAGMATCTVERIAPFGYGEP